MVETSNLLILRALLVIILLVIFSFFFFLPVFAQYSEKLTNLAKIAEKAEFIDVPTFTICTGWKESVMKKYNVRPNVFFFPPGNDTNLPINLRTLFDETTYKLSEDFSISISGDLSKPKPLKVGRNEINEKGIIWSFEVKENPAYSIGMCYVIIPDQILMRPIQDTLTISTARNHTDGKDEISKLFLQITSKDTFNIINYKTSDVMEQEFVSNDTYLKIDYTEENTEFLKDCSESPLYKCWAEKIVDTKEFNCTKKWGKCVSVVYSSLMQNVEHDIPECFDNSEEYCMLGLEGYKTYEKLRSTCLKQCQNKASRLEISKVEGGSIFTQGQVQLDIYFTVSSEKIFYKEYLIYDGIGMFGSIGGSLGLFVGFSIFDSLCPILEFLLKKLNFIQASKGKTQVHGSIL